MDREKEIKEGTERLGEALKPYLEEVVKAQLAYYEQGAKDTAQELYTALKGCIFREVGIGGVVMNEYIYWNKAKEFFKKYGIEVDE